MKFKCTLSSMGVTWLERFVPIFDKMGKELSVLFTPETLHLVRGAADSGGLELHADLLVKEAFDELVSRVLDTPSLLTEHDPGGGGRVRLNRLVDSARSGCACL